jgi:hypothetical protein
VLIGHPADGAWPRSINCYLVEVRDFAAAAPSGEGKKFKINPRRLLYSLQWTHNATPPDFELVPVQAEPPGLGRDRKFDAARRLAAPGARGDRLERHAGRHSVP